MEKSESQHGRVLVLLGAGASVPVFPSTQELTTMLRADNTWLWPSGPHPDCMFPANHQGASRLGFFEGLAQFVESFPGHPPVNFEDLIEFVEVVADARQAEAFPSYDPASWFLRCVFPEMARVAIGFFEGNRLRTVTQDARLVLLRAIFQRACQHAALFEWAPVNIFLRQLTQIAAVHIASLNYDNLVDGSGIRLDAGFRTLPGCSDSLFDPAVVTSYPWSRTDVLFMPLHGSVHFGLHVDRDELHVVWFDRLKTAQQSLASGFQIRAGHRDRQDLYPLMITSRRKAAAVQAPPFSTYLAKFRQSAWDADAWVIVGYGGGDMHINAVLSEVMGARYRYGRGPQILLCDHGDAAALSQLAGRIFTPVPVFAPIAAGPWHELRIGKSGEGSPIGWAWGQGLDAMAHTAWPSRLTLAG